MSATHWVASLCEAYGFGWREVLEMPFVTFRALHRLRMVEDINRKRRVEFEKSMGR